MSISTCEPGSVLQRLGTLISHMPSSILNSLNIYGSLLQWAWCRAQTKSKCVPLTHFWKSLRESSKPSICLCLFKTRREWSIQYYRSHLCPQGYFLDKSPKDKVEEWLYWIRAKTHIAQAVRNEGISTTCCYFMNIQSLIHTISTFIRVE